MKNNIKNTFYRIINYIKSFFKKSEEKELSDLIKERNRLNGIIYEKQELDRLAISKGIMERSLELMKYDQTLNDDKLNFQNEELSKARQEISKIKINSPLLVEPDDIVHHNENLNPTSPTILSLKSTNNEYVEKQLKAQAINKNKIENYWEEARGKKSLKR
jgi:hypothetical protein